EREAKRYGVLIVGSEIVGLVPQKALDMAADFYLQLENFSAAQVLENRLAACLGQMVAQLSRQKKSQAQFAEQLSTALAELRRAADSLARAIDEDAVA